MSEDRIEEDTWRLKESFESFVHNLNRLHPELFGTDEAVEKLLKWTPEYFEFKKSPLFDEGSYEEGDEDAPFFTETFLYNLLGKSDGRTLMRLLRDALGLKAVGKHL